jgi:hypothetical protein
MLVAASVNKTARVPDKGARVVGRRRNESGNPSVNETARMTAPALFDGGATRAARGRYPAVNYTAMMTAPALLDGGATRAAKGRYPSVN